MILIQADKETLLRPLQTIAGIVERRHTLPILSNVLIERNEKEILYMATDLEIQITTTITTITTEKQPCVVTVAAKKLQDILRALPDKAEVTLEIEEKKLQVKSGKSRFNLQTLSAEDFPRFKKNDLLSRVKITIKQKELKNLLFLVQYAMAQQDIRYYLNGLLLLIEDGRLKVVTTDGHRLGFALTPLKANQIEFLSKIPSLERAEIILPRKVILELAKQLNESEELVIIEILENQAQFTFSNIVLVTKTVDGKFPDYNRVIPTGHQKQFEINRLVFLQALQRVSILSNEKIRGARLILTTKTLRIVCNNNEKEEAQEEIEIKYSGEALDIGFNSTYLLDVLSSLTSETVECSFGDTNSSALITIPNNENFKYVVMPMRL
ncbi:MAG: DNA polymerase III subunit beta [Nitrosospira sp.]|nr:DNA polymerase III subunit beta [Nitrosospira sp.]MBI0415117.1 DNA polymerase III subunit beta [Nitrosospira sp.]MBI0416261.1 DNA polymerase III subunit beta [Nitrosospira sp.]MBI0417249.1 DNA polymerase III subunit beta [Nitrosospira sp.]MBI0418393.1 DNA polymerase III subunit beta [Nitrosospira sp.]